MNLIHVPKKQIKKSMFRKQNNCCDKLVPTALINVVFINGVSLSLYLSTCEKVRTALVNVCVIARKGIDCEEASFGVVRRESRSREESVWARFQCEIRKA